MLSVKESVVAPEAACNLINCPSDVTQCLSCIMGNVGLWSTIGLIMDRSKWSEPDTSCCTSCSKPPAYITHNATQPEHLSSSSLIIRIVADKWRRLYFHPSNYFPSESFFKFKSKKLNVVLTHTVIYDVSFCQTSCKSAKTQILNQNCPSVCVRCRLDGSLLVIDPHPPLHQLLSAQWLLHLHRWVLHPVHSDVSLPCFPLWMWINTRRSWGASEQCCVCSSAVSSLIQRRRHSFFLD